ncbi:hypothetical protein C8Q74DRAFT_622325 [Fomes fomentarius]|nr:hypothetical protein C8Q74DRAFT_622325 [Fomes fomentarius]
MTSRTATYIDYAATPGSERTAFFDAPLMMSESNSAGNELASLGVKASPPEDKELPGAFMEDESKEREGPAGESSPNGSAFVEHIIDDDSTAPLNRKPSVGLGLPRDPIVRMSPVDGNEEIVQDIDDAEGDDGHHPKVSHRRLSSAVTDSGYGSGSNAPRSQSRQSKRSSTMEPIPILWTESPHDVRPHRSLVDGEGDESTARRDGNSFKRASSLRSFRSTGLRPSLLEREDRSSIRTTPTGAEKSTLRRRRISLGGGSFASGAGTVGPASSVVLDETFQNRSRSAELALTEKQKVKLSKNQVKEGKKVAKIIKAEGKAEKQALDEALKELADLQKMQKVAVKEEGKAYTAYSKALRDFHKNELEFFAARAKYERAQADLRAQEDARDASRNQARETTEMLQEKNREVEWLRAQKAVDDREREAKVRQLTGKA